MRIAMEKSGNVMLIIGYISRERRESLAASDNQPLLQGLQKRGRAYSRFSGWPRGPPMANGALFFLRSVCQASVSPLLLEKNEKLFFSQKQKEISYRYEKD